MLTRFWFRSFVFCKVIHTFWDTTTTHLVGLPLNVVINLDDLIAVGVGKELIPGLTGLDKTELARLFESVRHG